MREKHSEEVTLQQYRHRTESETLRHNHQKERSQFPVQPAGLEKKQEHAWQAMIAKHKVEREDLKRKQEAEIARAKGRAA